MGLTCNLLYNSNSEGGFDFVNGVGLPAPTCALRYLTFFLPVVINKIEYRYLLYVVNTRHILINIK